MNNSLVIKQPASWFSQLWREATPLGNGFTGALVYGGTATEHILFNRCDLWHGAKDMNIPDVSESFLKMREYMDKGDYNTSRDFLCNELKNRGYNPKMSYPYPLGMLKIEMLVDGVFSHYRRCLHLDKAECEISYTENKCKINRKCFVSRDLDVFVYNAECDNEKEFKVSFDLHNDYTEDTKKDELLEKLSIEYEDEYIFFIVKDNENSYGAVVKVLGGKRVDNKIVTSGKNFKLLVKCFSKYNNISKEQIKTKIDKIDFDYDKLLKNHESEHRKLYERTSVSFCDKEENMSNEELLAVAYEDKASASLIEKLWKFGRYLFICATAEDGLPVPLYGLWHGEYRPIFSQHVGNENVQMIYWHILTGNLSGLMLPLIKYYCSEIDKYRECASKFFGCRGIYIGAYSTPEYSQGYHTTPVILHYISTAGWLCQHFYNYYKMTKDKEILYRYILPFMIETALFYEDYACYKEGVMEIYPSVSPENSPGNFVTDYAKPSHPMPVVKNSTMDFAILKELLINLLELSKDKENNITLEQTNKWNTMLNSIPDYMINEDGAVKEWISDEFSDNYLHRHLSHLYPVFPGEEVGLDNPLIENFKKAVKKRDIQSSTGWSLVHTAAIYSALGQAENAVEYIDALCKSCILKNFMSIHNDFRNMGISWDLEDFAPIQLDAVIGTVNVVQMMLLQYTDETLKILPALPKRLDFGKVKKLAFYGGCVDISWDKTKVEAKVLAVRDLAIKIILPNIKEEYFIYKNGVKSVYDKNKMYFIKQGESLVIDTK